MAQDKDPGQAGAAWSAYPELVSALEAIGVSLVAAGNTILFRQGQPQGGIFVLRKGRLRLLLEQQHVYRTVVPGAILGLPATLSNEPYSLTAQALEDCELVQVSRERLLELIRTRNELSLQVVEGLAEEVRRVRKYASEFACDMSEKTN